MGTGREWKNPFPKFGNGKGMKKKPFPQFKNREGKKKIHNFQKRKGMKK